MTAGRKTHILSTQEFADGTKEEGFQFLFSFSFDDSPVWKFLVDGIVIRKEIGMVQGENTAGVRYTVDNRTQNEIVFTALLQL